ncbi:unnamed protein product, partial [Mesorhabditis spiculigera]
MTAKQLEQETGCKIMVRGKGSMRDKKKEELNRGKPNWEHLNEELHVLIQVEDTQNRAKVKLQRAVDEIKKLLVPAPEGEDELKRKQLMELAIINGTYRSTSQQNAVVAAQLAAAKQTGMAAIQAAALAQAQGRSLQLQLAGAGAAVSAGQIRSPGLAGAPIIMSPQARQVGASQAALIAQQQALNAAATSQSAENNLMAHHQAALMAQQQQAVDYQQLLLGQQAAMGLDAQTLQAMQFAQQQQLAAAGYGGMLGQYMGAEYGVQDLTGAAAQSAPGAILQQRRLLGSSRDHPYKQ